MKKLGRGSRLEQKNHNERLDCSTELLDARSTVLLVGESVRTGNERGNIVKIPENARLMRGGTRATKARAYPRRGVVVETLSHARIPRSVTSLGCAAVQNVPSMLPALSEIAISTILKTDVLEMVFPHPPSELLKGGSSICLRKNLEIACSHSRNPTAANCVLPSQ